MHIEKLLRKVSKTAPPEFEDSVLLRLAETHYHDVHTGQHTEVSVELREVAALSDGPHLNIPGPVRHQVFGCSYPHLLPDAPYEEYERHLFPADMAERSAEFKLFLAFLDNSVVAEPT
jgi:hypothetical protein